MPAGIQGSFTIKGDVRSATKSAREFGEAVTSLNRRLGWLLKKRNELNAFNRALTSGSTRMRTWTKNAEKATQAARNLTNALRDLRQEQQQQETAPPAQANLQNLFGPMAQYAKGQLDTSQLQTGLKSAVNLTTLLSAGASKAVAVFGLLAGVVKTALGGAIQFVKKQWNSFKQALNNVTTQLPRVTASFARFGMNVTDGLRLITLGMTNMFRSVMFFISIPLIGFLYQAGTAILDFDDGLKRVQKTTGLWSEDLEILRRELRDLAMTTRTSHVQLAQMAEDAGQLGLKTIKGIMGMVKLGNMLAVATDITEDTVVETLGRIANAFAYNLDKSTDEIWRLANVINKLENETETSAAEIVEAIYQFAPIGALLDMTSYSVAALGATLTSMGYDASKAGTALRNLGIYMSKNHEDVERLLGGWEKYAETGSVAKKMNEDFLEVMIDFIRAASEEGDKVERLSELMEVLNLRGGRGAASLAENLGDLAENLAIARQEYENGTSLLIEYDRAMSSTKSQLAVLRNNFTELGITIGDVVLPVINRMVQFLIPVVQRLTEEFTKLSPATQKFIILGIALLAVIGPLMMFLSQVVHGIFLMSMGFFTLLKVVPTVLTILFALGRMIFSLIGLFSFWRIVSIGGVFLILKALQKMGVDVHGFFKDLAERALAWGERLSSEYSSGLIKGAVNFISKALAWIANLIAGFFEAKSPPRKGPLRNIREWGRAVMRTFLEAFTTADFTILSRVGRIIENAFENIAARLDRADDWIIEMTQNARQWLARLIAAFNETGVIAEDMLNRVVSGLGDMAGPVAELIRRWLRYRQIQQQLADLEQRRQQYTRDYRERLRQIAAMNVSAEERVRLIRQAMGEYNEEMDLMDEEQENLEAQEEAAQDELEWQQAYVDALLEEDNLQRRLLRTLERMAGAMEDLSEMQFPEPVSPFEWDQDTQDAFEALYNLPQRIEDARMALEGLWTGLAGLPPDIEYLEGLPDNVKEDYEWLYEVGHRISLVWSAAQGAFDALFGTHMDWEAFANLTPENQEAYENMYQTVSDLKDTFSELADALGEAWENVKKLFSKGEGGLLNVDTYLQPIENLKKGIKDLFKWVMYLSGAFAFLTGFFATEPFEPLKRSATKFNELKIAIEDLAEKIFVFFALISQPDSPFYIFYRLLYEIGRAIFFIIQGFLWLGGVILGTLIRCVGWTIGYLTQLLIFLYGFLNIFMTFMNDLASGKGLAESIARFMHNLGQLGDEIKYYFEEELPKSIREDVVATGEASGELWGLSMIFGMDKALTNKYKSTVLEKLRETTGEIETYMDTDQQKTMDKSWEDIGESGGEKFSKKTGDIIKEKWPTDVNQNTMTLLEELGTLSGNYLGLTYPTEIAGPAQTAGASISTNLTEGLQTTIQEQLPETISDPMTEEILKTIELILEKQADMKGSGEVLVDQFGEGMLTKMDPVQADMLLEISELLLEVDGYQDDFEVSGGALTESMQTSMLDPLDWVDLQTKVSTKVQNVLDKIDAKENQFKSAGKSLLQNLIDGLTNGTMWTALSNKLAQKLQSIIDRLKRMWRNFANSLNISVSTSGGGDGCFIAGTPITLFEGSTKPIEEIQIGDLVWSYDESTHWFQSGLVVGTSTVRRTDTVLVKTTKGNYQCSDNHLWLTDSGWIEATYLVQGDLLVTDPLMDEKSKVLSVHPMLGKHRVYNFTVDETQTYLVDGQVVHNDKTPLAAGGGRARKGQPMIVGEKDWEVFVPGMDGWILNQEQLAAYGLLSNTDLAGLATAAATVVNGGINENISIVFKDTVIRDEYDLKELVRMLEKIINDKVINANRYRAVVT